VSFARIRGQKRAIAQLRPALAAGRLAHAYLFTGPEGVGKRSLARELARAVLCEKQGEDACDRCLSCRGIEAGSSLEYGQLAVEESSGRWRPVDDTDREIKVGSVRAMERELRVKPAPGRTRVFLTPDADRMNEEAQNALLKTLEEPVGARLLLFTSARPDALLPTVRSRLARVRLRRLSPEEIAEFLVSERQMPPAEARDLALASAGSIGAALSGSAGARRAARAFALKSLGQARAKRPRSPSVEAPPRRTSAENSWRHGGPQDSCSVMPCWRLWARMRRPKRPIPTTPTRCNVWQRWARAAC